MSLTEILIKVAQLILSLSILVVLHEMGHFVTAKIFKCRVEKFYLFFDPWFSLFKKKVGETEYGVGWLPLGGYVKISGMIDESMDKEQMKLPPQPWEFRAKPAWQRLIIMIAGVTVNLLLAFFIYAMMLWHWGESYLPAQNVKYGIVADSLAQTIGLRDGDKIVALDHNPVDNFARIPGDIILKEVKSIQVIRDGSEKDIAIPAGFVGSMIRQLKKDKEKGTDLIIPRFPFYADRFAKESAGKKAGIRKEDHIIAVNGEATPYFNDVSSALRKHAGQSVQVGILRGDDSLNITVPLPETAKLGIYPVGDMSRFFKIEVKKYNFFQSFPAGITKGVNTLVGYVQQLRLIFVSKEVKASESLGGFISIGNLFPGEWDWRAFWSMTAFLSIILAFMNILPIPALDGGHVLFLLSEIITGRKPSDKFLEYAQVAGMVILFGLLLYANGLDVWRHWFGH